MKYPDDAQLVMMTAGDLRSMLKAARAEKVSHRTFRRAFRAGTFRVVLKVT